MSLKKNVDLVCKIDEFDYVNVEVNTVYSPYMIDRNADFIIRLSSASHKPEKNYLRKK